MGQQSRRQLPPPPQPGWDLSVYTQDQWELELAPAPQPGWHDLRQEGVTQALSTAALPIFLQMMTLMMITWSITCVLLKVPSMYG